MFLCERPVIDCTVCLVAALDKNRVIGVDGELPWHYPQDLERFKQITTGHPVVMGRKTYESITEKLDGLLPGRANIVLTQSSGCLPYHPYIAKSIPDALMNLERHAAGLGVETGYVIGGASVYEQLLPEAEKMLLTRIQDEYDGDTYFPEFDKNQWTERCREEYDEFAVVEYTR